MIIPLPPRYSLREEGVQGQGGGYIHKYMQLVSLIYTSFFSLHRGSVFHRAKSIKGTVSRDFLDQEELIS